MYFNTSGDKMSKPWEKSIKEDGKPSVEQATVKMAVDLALIAAPIAASMIAKGATLTAVSPTAVNLAWELFSKSYEMTISALKVAQEQPR